MIRERLCNELSWELGFTRNQQNKESVCTRPPGPWPKLNFALVAICCAIKSPQPAKMGPKIASQNGLCSLLFFPKKKREKANTIGELKK